SGAEADREMQDRVRALRQGLQDLGWMEGHNYQFEYRWPANDPELIKRQAVELAALAPDVVVAGTALGVSTLRRETSTIPVVFVDAGESKGGGLVSRRDRAGKQMNGVPAFGYNTTRIWSETPQA